MTIEEIIEDAFSQGWNASHECATDFDYQYALRNCLSELDSKIKELNAPAVIPSVCVGCTVVDYRNEWVDPCHSCINGSNKQIGV